MLLAPLNTYYAEDRILIGILAFFVLVPGLGPRLGIPGFGRGGGLMSYSKFAHAADKVTSSCVVRSRLGMTMMYAPSALLAFATWGYVNDHDPASHDFRAHHVAVLVMLHFLKRTGECLFLHKYSGTMPMVSSAFIGAFYCVSVLIMVSFAYFSDQHAVELGLSQDPIVQHVGFALFAAGELGNLYHHYLLANLRKPGETAYKVPAGGLFEFVAAPHYLCEIVAWAGIACIMQHVAGWLVVAAITFYLTERAVAQSKWNRSKLGSKYPRNRGHILPFLF